MPIEIDRFEDATDLDDPTTGERIVRFLASNDDLAYTRREIADAIDAAPETVGTNLTRLKARGLVRHREPYWAFTDDHRQAIKQLRAQYGDQFVATLPVVGPRSEGHGDGTTDDPEQTSANSVLSRPESRHRQATERFRSRVHDQLDDAIAALFLFGSVGRGDHSERSDVDILAVIADHADYATVDDQLLDIAYNVQLEFEVPVEVHAIEEREFVARRDRGEPFVRTVVEEGDRLV